MAQEIGGLPEVCALQFIFYKCDTFRQYDCLRHCYFVASCKMEHFQQEVCGSPTIKTLLWHNGH